MRELNLAANQTRNPAHSPRWGFGKPPHREIAALLERGCPNYALRLAEIAKHKDFLHSIPLRTESTISPFWQNPFFSALDAAALTMLLLERKPQRYLEIGSGNSTKFARHAIQHADLSTRVTSIDPQPRAEIDRLCDQVIRAPVQDCDLAVFDELQPGDILFFDGSHRCGSNSDVTIFFLEILPRLKPGVLVQIHDIFWPYDYIPEFIGRNYNEQYMLGTFLLRDPPQVNVILPNYFVCAHRELAETVRGIFANPAGEAIPFHYKRLPHLTGVSFWMETSADRNAP